MNNEQTKIMIEQAMKKPEYFLSHENDIHGIVRNTSSILGFEFAMLPFLEINPIITSVGAITLGAGFAKLLDISRADTKEEKQQQKKDYYSYKMLKKYNKQLKKGKNPCSDVEFSEKAFYQKLSNDVELKYAKVFSK